MRRRPGREVRIQVTGSRRHGLAKRPRARVTAPSRSRSHGHTTISPSANTGSLSAQSPNVSRPGYKRCVPDSVRPANGGAACSRSLLCPNQKTLWARFDVVRTRGPYLGTLFTRAANSLRSNRTASYRNCSQRPTPRRAQQKKRSSGACRSLPSPQSRLTPRKRTPNPPGALNTHVITHPC